MKKVLLTIVCCALLFSDCGREKVEDATTGEISSTEEDTVWFKGIDPTEEDWRQSEGEQIQEVMTEENINDVIPQSGSASQVVTSSDISNQVRVARDRSIAGTKAISNDPNLENVPDDKSITIDESEFDPNRRVANGPSQYDSRIDIHQLRPDQPWQKKILSSSRSVGMLVEKQNLHAISDTIFQLDITTTLQQRYNLCADAGFCQQPVIGTGTAFLISSDHMVTAAHVFERPLSEYVVLFGFEMVNQAGGYSKIVTASNIYQPIAITNAQPDLDVAVFSLDRATTRPALKLGNSTQYTTGEPIFMLGHPSGLPLKCALNASLRGKSAHQYFYTTLDAFQGNSGSPVFSLVTNEVIGVLVAGEVDFHWNGNCNRVKPCRIPYCEGEKVIRIEQVERQI